MSQTAWAQQADPGEAQPETPPTEAPEASETAGPEDPQAIREAKGHFHKGMEHFTKHEYRKAIRDFQVASALVPSADLWFNIARAHEELSEYDQAVEHYGRYLRDRVDPPDEQEVKAHIEELKERAEQARQARQQRPTTGTLRIRSNVPGARISLNDKPIGKAPLGEALMLGPGRYRLEVQAEPYVPFRAAVRVEAGLTTAAYADMVPYTRYRAIRGSRFWTWIVGGASIAALGFAGGFGIEATSRLDDGDLSGAKDMAVYSDYALGASLVLGLSAVALYFFEGRAIGTERITTPAPPSQARAQTNPRSF